MDTKKDVSTLAYIIDRALITHSKVFSLLAKPTDDGAVVLTKMDSSEDDILVLKRDDLENLLFLISTTKRSG